LQHGIQEWWSRRKHEKKNSVLDYARGKFGDSFVDDVKTLQGVVYIFLPLPVFWSLFDQQVKQIYENLKVKQFVFQQDVSLNIIS
jgi:hypothetical protein